MLVNLNGTPWEKAAFNPHGMHSLAILHSD